MCSLDFREISCNKHPVLLLLCLSFARLHRCHVPVGLHHVEEEARMRTGSKIPALLKRQAARRRAMRPPSVSRTGGSIAQPYRLADTCTQINDDFN